MYTFEIDPSKTGSLETHHKFVDYLASKELVLDIYGGDSLLYFGQAKVPLCNLLRQGKQSESFSSTLEISTFDQGRRDLGILQISMQNTGQELPPGAKVAGLTSTNGALASGLGGANKFGKKKARSFKPMDITSELKKTMLTDASLNRGVDDGLMGEEHRKMLRL